MSSLALFLLVGLASAAPANTTSLSPAEASLSSKVAALSTYDWNSYITNTSYNQWGYPVTTQTYVISTSFTPSYKQYGTRSVMVGQPVTTATILLEDSEYSDSEEEDTVVIPTDLPKSDKENIVSLLKSANLAFPATAGDDDVHGDEPTDHHEGDWPVVPQTHTLLPSIHSRPSVVTAYDTTTLVSTIPGQFTTITTTVSGEPSTVPVISTKTDWQVVPEIRPYTIIKNQTLWRSAEVVKPTTIIKEIVVPQTITRDRTAFVTTNITIPYSVTKEVMQTAFSNVIIPVTRTLNLTQYSTITDYQISTRVASVSTMSIPTTTTTETHYNVATKIQPTIVVSQVTVVSTQTLSAETILSTVTELEFSISHTTRTKTRPIWSTTRETSTITLPQKTLTSLEHFTNTEYIEIPIPTTVLKTKTRFRVRPGPTRVLHDTAYVQVPTISTYYQFIPTTIVKVPPPITTTTTEVEYDTEWIWQEPETITIAQTTTEWNEAVEYKTTTRFIHPRPRPTRRPGPKPQPKPLPDNDFEDLSGNDADKPNFKDFAETYSQYEQYKRCFQNCISSPRNTPDRCQRRCWRSVSLIQRGDEEMEGVKKETDDAVEVEAPTDPFEESDEDLEDEAMFEDEVVEEDTQEE